MRYDPVSLRLFLAIAETGSISAGAARVHLALAAASRRILNLEHDAGMPLLERQPRGVVTTPAGNALLGHAREIVDALERLKADMAAFGAGVQGHVRVYANTSSVIQFLPEDLHRFMQAHPGLRIDLEELPSEEIVQAVRDGQAEVGIFDASADAAGIESRPYREDRLVLLVPGDHRLAGHERIAFDEALDEDFVSLRSGTAVRRLAADHARRAGRPFKVRIQVRGFEAVCRMVHARVGVGLLPAAAVQAFAGLPAVHRIELTDAWARRSHRIGYRQLAALPRAARAFVEFLCLPSHDAKAAFPDR
jgi:DNA-binding transcriptional LysR family regulator